MKKLIAIAGLILVLLVPLTLVSGLVDERAHRRDEVQQEVRQAWGQDQRIAGPLLYVPVGGNAVAAGPRDGFYVLPEVLHVEGVLFPVVRHRGIFEVPVQRMRLKITGTFKVPELADATSPESGPAWAQARVLVGLTDTRSLGPGLSLAWGGSSLALLPGSGEVGLLGRGLQALVPAAPLPGGEVPFQLELELNGGPEVSFLPLGKDTTVHLASTWPDPGFVGAFLPRAPRVDAAGFDATWTITWFGRDYGQVWRAGSGDPSQLKEKLAGSSFGVRLVTAVDDYRQIDRALKYGVLFLFLTFAGFVLWEVQGSLLLHPVQYLLVGFALILFYLLLLSLSEQIGFRLAYAGAALATVGLIGGYARSTLRGTRRAMVLCLGLGSLYGYLFVLLQLQDYALVVGSGALFVILGLVMYATREVDWDRVLGSLCEVGAEAAGGIGGEGPRR